ncbi:MAG TPA: peptidoglycan editing factor PgeF [Steroidobacteraceae bacterium]|nr:peptidoglycan editing factor PgeF [Steroidobacteraceae bacterium]
MSLRVIEPDWPAPANVRAASTLRSGGVSEGPFASLNLGDHVGDQPAAVRENRARLMSALGLAEEPLWMQQVHGTSVVHIGESERSSPRPVADATVASGPARPCVVLTADCLPVLLCDRAGRSVAAAHAGWRGLVRGVLAQTVAALAVPTTELLAWLGPAIGPEAFEVGEEVRQGFLERDAAHAHAFVPNARGRWQADLYQLARNELHALGVTEIHGGGFCTHRNSDDFFSYRRDGETGRMATLIWLSGSG